jgi:hypothetical protein
MMIVGVLIKRGGGVMKKGAADGREKEGEGCSKKSRACLSHTHTHTRI